MYFECAPTSLEIAPTTSRSQVRMRMAGWQCWMPASLLLYLGDLSSIPFFISATSLVFLDYQLFVELVSCVLWHVWKGPMKVAACTTETGQKWLLQRHLTFREVDCFLVIPSGDWCSIAGNVVFHPPGMDLLSPLVTGSCPHFPRLPRGFWEDVWMHILAIASISSCVQGNTA